MNIKSVYIIPLAFCFLTACSQDIVEPEKAFRSVEVTELHPESFYSQKQFTGVIQSSQKSKLSFRVPGVIEEVLVKEGESVKKGQLLARLDPHDFEVHLSELMARRDEATAAFDLAKIELDRIKQATDDDAIAKVNLDRAISGFKRSEAMVNVMQKNIQKAQDALSYTQLKAPFDGVIAQQKIDVFEQVIPGISIFTLHKLDTLEAVIDVPENMIEQLNSVEKAKVQWYNSNTIIDATFQEKSTQPDPIKQTYKVSFKLANVPKGILPGKSITLSIAVEPEEDNFCLPYSAIVGEHSSQNIFTVEQGKINTVPVQVETLNANLVCLKGDLKTGQKVVVTGAPFFKQGDSVGPMLFVNR
jgi:RND family efflux transporter MFP subunit